MRKLHLRPQRKPRSGRTGFSLVEILVAVAIITIGLGALIPMLAFNVKSNVVSRSVGLANHLAEQRLEKIRSWPIYETTTIAGQTALGINTDNTELFYTDTVDMASAGYPEVFTVSAEMYHNGHTQNCTGLVFGSGGSPNVNDGGNMNTGQIKGDCTSGYRGEDFKVVRVTVAWDDQFHTPPIRRYAYIAKW